MTTAAPSTALVTIRPAVTDAGRFALAGFLAGYRGLTRDACALGLRRCASWRRARPVTLFAVRRAGLEGFAREPEARGRARATVTRRLSTIAGSGKYAGQEELPDRSPAAPGRRPRTGCESRAVALDRGEPGDLRVAAGPGPPAGHALVSLPALTGVRVFGAAGAGIGQPGPGRGPGPWPSPATAARRRPSRWRRAPPGRPAGPPASAPRCQDHQERHARHAAARVHHRRPGWRGAAPRCPGGGFRSGSADHDAG